MRLLDCKTENLEEEVKNAKNEGLKVIQVNHDFIRNRVFLLLEKTLWTKIKEKLARIKAYLI